MTQSPHPLDIHIGQRLRLRRKLLGMSQVELARQVGFTFQQLQKYELGRNSINVKRLYDFSIRLQVPFTYFLDGYADDQAHMPLAELSTQAIHLVQDYSSIPSVKVRNSIAAFVREVAKEASRGL